MVGIKILGCSGGSGKDRHTSAIQITKNTLIDAGNILEALGDKAKFIDNIFISHSHLDHLVDCAYLLDDVYHIRNKPIKIYALSETIEALKKHIFNWKIWPDFSQIELITGEGFALKFVEIVYGKEYMIEEGIVIKPFPSNHTVECCGFIIQSDEGAVLYSSDTYQNDEIWKLVNQNKNIKAILIDVSFPSRMYDIALKSKHLTPLLLKIELEKLKRDDIQIYINHTKPSYEKEISTELKMMGLKDNIINEGDIIFYKNGNRINANNNEKLKVEKLIKIGIALSYQKNLNLLLEMIVEEARKILNADGGTLYLVENDKLKFTVVQTDSLGIKMGGTGNKINWESLPLYIDGKPNNKMVAVTCALKGEIINIQDIYSSTKFDFSGTREFDRKTGYRSKSMLVLPLKDHEDNVIGVLQLINKINYFENSIEHFNKEDERIAVALSSQAAVAISNNLLIRDLEKLLEAFLNSIIYAIGKKSTHTASHIERMAELTNEIAKSIDEDTELFKNINFNDDELKQIKLAALMHDIGKLSIPEYIIDKSKKLENLIDGIELIKQRVEIIKKELEIAWLKDDISRKEALKEQRRLDEYFQIIHLSNLGKKYIDKKTENLLEKLSNKSYFLNGKKYKVLTKEECEKLKVKKGTLTDKEREIINSHAEITLEILSKLPFPKKYKRIPEIASNHHEKINGKGYPRGLKGNEISFEARILAIADIFEALTANDRPYKQANMLSTAMKILFKMAKNNELDRDLVKFFYNSGLYLKYANLFIPKEYIDKVDIEIDF